MKVKEEAVVVSAFSHLKIKLGATSGRRLEQPLPMPFELPHNYPTIVMVDLEQKKLSGKARAKFIASISSAIFKYKGYPTRDEYNHVGAQIVKKYPFLRSSSGTGYVSTVNMSYRNVAACAWGFGCVMLSAPYPHGIWKSANIFIVLSSPFCCLCRGT